jgi:hypothetical protein
MITKDKNPDKYQCLKVPIQSILHNTSERKFNYSFLIKYCSENNIQLTEDYSTKQINRETKIKANCLTENCFELIEKTFRCIVMGGGCYCKKCNQIIKIKKYKKSCLEKYGYEYPIQNAEIQKKQKKTFLEKYGVENPSQNKEIREKSKKTCLEKYGVEQASQNKEVQEKSKQTFLEKYGVENPSQNKEVQEKAKQTCLEKYGVENPSQNKEVREKSKQTCLEKYGVEHSLQNKEVREKSKQTCLEKYGVEHPLQNKEVREKSKQTCLEKYGVECSLKNIEVQEKIKKTCLEKYGVENPLQNPEILDKASKNSYRSKIFTFPSGNAISCQGYEPFALKELSQTHQETDIVTGCKNVPKLSYKDDTGKNHKHFVDIFIPSENKCIEVKSTWTIKLKNEIILLKQESAKTAGYKYEIWIYNAKGEKVEFYK